MAKIGMLVLLPDDTRTAGASTKSLDCANSNHLTHQNRCNIILAFDEISNLKEYERQDLSWRIDDPSHWLNKP